MPSYVTLAACAAGLVLTLVLAAFFTPSHWWRQMNLRALAIVSAGTWAIASLLLMLAPAPGLATVASAPTRGIASLAPTRQHPPASYQVFDDLNLRAGRGTAAQRLAVVPAGTIVTTTGLRDGDWWQVRARVDGRQVLGWSSSLWLRRADERRD